MIVILIIIINNMERSKDSMQQSSEPEKIIPKRIENFIL